MKKSCFGIAVLGLLVLPLQAAAEGDPATYCKQAAELYAADDIPGAVEEAKWCLESLEQIQQARKSEGFPKQVAGWKQGEISQHKAMGLSNIEAQYTMTDKTIKVSYTSGGGGMAAMFSQMGLATGGGKKIRIGRYTGMVMEKGSRKEIVISLKMTPGMINLSSSNATLDELSAFAKAFPVKDIDQ
ncbi:MAG: hypothetical protein KZQ88_00360 [Candidatus Thiodiazotropha sp. (ex Dulcina madagascariensis)]|nr:hypothetical protein [Candidatus Thiodiazotropha sp. (ex Dulcina madagascariensis)]MCU7928024.1 hypothetical protein [Candidatus Thiodiazotropha sp. (ex Dulcina madagascariensis)]